MKKTILVMLALLMATGCANNMPASQNNPEHSTDNSASSGIIAETGEISSEPFWDFVDDIGEKIDTISFTKDMGSYFINLSVDVYYVDRTNSYRLDVNGDNITVRSGEEVLSSMVFNNPCVGGAPFAGVNDYKGIAAEVLEMDSGNLLVVSVPFEIIEDENAQCLSVYYFDDHFVNYIGTRKGGGDFFPLIDGEITTDGDTFTVNEYVGSEREKRTVTYSVDFENILIKEVTE